MPAEARKQQPSATSQVNFNACQWPFVEDVFYKTPKTGQLTEMRIASWKTPSYINIHYKMFQIYFVYCLKTIQELRNSFKVRLFTGPARVWMIILVKGLHILLIFFECLGILNLSKIYFKIKHRKNCECCLRHSLSISVY